MAIQSTTGNQPGEQFQHAAEAYRIARDRYIYHPAGDLPMGSPEFKVLDEDWTIAARASEGAFFELITEPSRNGHDLALKLAACAQEYTEALPPESVWLELAHDARRLARRGGGAISEARAVHALQARGPLAMLDSPKEAFELLRSLSATLAMAQQAGLPGEFAADMMSVIDLLSRLGTAVAQADRLDGASGLQ